MKLPQDSCLVVFCSGKIIQKQTNKQKMWLCGVYEVQGQGDQINGDVKSKWGRWHRLGRDMRES